MVEGGLFGKRKGTHGEGEETMGQGEEVQTERQATNKPQPRDTP